MASSSPSVIIKFVQKQKTGLGFSAWADLRPGLHPSQFNRRLRGRAEISAWLAGLKFAM